VPVLLLIIAIGLGLPPAVLARRLRRQKTKIRKEIFKFGTTNRLSVMYLCLYLLSSKVK